MKLLTHTLKGLVLVYKHGISPYLPGTCRYQPTCSTYMLQALERFGPFKGGWLGLKRMCRCHPWGHSGYDPLPTHEDLRKNEKE